MTGQFPESALAHRYLDGLKGIEIGGSLHNHFNIEGCLNVDYTDEHTGHKQAEIDLCGAKLPVDIVAEGDKLPFEDNSYDFVISSHNLEHMPNMLGALIEWCRVVKDGGLLFIVYPIKDMNEDDQKYEFTTHEHIIQDWSNGETVETHPCLPGQGPRGHYHFLTLESFIELIGKFFEGGLEVIETEERDGKVGNGWTCLIRVLKNHIVPELYRNI